MNNYTLLKVESVISSVFPLISTKNLSKDCSLTDYAGLDSFSFLQLIVALEESFSISIDDELLLYDNFNSIEKIVQTMNSMIEKQEEKL